MAVYYNEYDKNAAAWLRQLIKDGLLPDGEVDERSIVDVPADDLKGFVQHHFFAGIGGWPYALRMAGWPDDKPVWTGSCPCQPFSAAGKNKGKEDERHLWPAFFKLIKDFQPNVVFGEQVEGAIRHGWLDDIQRDLEGIDFALGHAVLGAHSVGAPHIRQRLYWVADNSAMVTQYDDIIQTDALEGVTRQAAEDARNPWKNPDWIYCRDNKYRPIKKGLKPLVARLPKGVKSGKESAPINADDTSEARVMRLKGYGNAIVPQVGAAFIDAFVAVKKAHSA